MNQPQFTVSATAFAKALAQIVPAVASRPIVPITENVLIVGTGSVVGTAASLKLVCSNLETTLSFDLSVESIENFACCIPARKLLTTLKGFPDCPVSCTVHTDPMRLDLKAGRSVYKLAGENPLDFPKAQKLDRNHQRITLPTNQLRAALAATLPLVTVNDVARPYFGAVLIETTKPQYADDAELRFVGSDGHRISVYQVPADAISYDDEDNELPGTAWSHAATVLVPRSAAQLLFGLLDPKDTALLTLLIDEGTVRLENGKWSAQRMDQPFPLYRGILPTMHSKTLDIDRDEMLSALRRITAYTPEGTNLVVVEISKTGTVILQADSPEWGNEGREELSGEYYGEALSICFGAQHLIDLLSLWPAGLIRFEMDQPNRSAVLTLASESDEPVLRCLVQPRPVLAPVAAA